MISIGIIGGGKGGLSIMHLVEGIPGVELRWVADIDEEAPAIKEARKKGIKTVVDFAPQVRDTSIQLVIEVTGNDRVRQILEEHKHTGLSIIDALGARFLVDIVKQRQQLIQQLHHKSQALAVSAENLSNNANQIRQSMEQLSKEAEELAQTGQELSKTAGEASRAVTDTNSILKIIENIANKTNIIGLNAAIEAARVGDAGRGFAVVADEIRKLAKNSSSSVEQIGGITKNIVQFMEKIVQGINSSGKTAQNQAAAAEEVLASLDEVATISASLKEMADDLVKIT
ncbi:MAG: methyl-accepting chemotaxis protein [Bacillota bacterium]